MDASEIDPAILDHAVPGSRAWRVMVCLRSVGRLHCGYQDDTIAPDRLLPFLKHIHSVDVTDANDEWVAALAERFENPRQRPEVMFIGMQNKCAPLRRFMDGRIPGLVIGGRDGADCCTFLELAKQVEKLGKGLRELGFDSPNGIMQDELEAILGCIAANSESLESIHIGRLNVEVSGSIEYMAVKMPMSLPRLTCIKMDNEFNDACDLLPQLVRLSVATLVELFADVGPKTIIKLPLQKLTKLRSLEIQYLRLDISSTESVYLQLYLRKLKKVWITWDGYRYQPSHLKVADWEEITKFGMPHVEEITISLDHISLCYDDGVDKSFVPLLHDVIVDAKKSPLLQHVILDLEKYDEANKFMGRGNFRLSGGHKRLVISELENLQAWRAQQMADDGATTADDAELAVASHKSEAVRKATAFLEDNLGALPLDLRASLHDGVLLCRLMNKLNPGSVPHVNVLRLNPFKEMENIASFLFAARAYGVQSHQLFQTADLHDGGGKNMGQVVVTLLALSRIATRRRVLRPQPVRTETAAPAPVPMPLHLPKKTTAMQAKDCYPSPKTPPRIARGDSKSSLTAMASDDYLFGDCIGKGQFGSVYKALNVKTGEVVAIKKIMTSQPDSEALPSILVGSAFWPIKLDEVKTLKSFSHPNVIKYYGFSIMEDHIRIVLEYAENGSILTVIKSFGVIPESLARANYVPKILNGLIYLHDNDIVHCDLKCANILATKDGNVKLSDFGVSRRLGLLEKMDNEGHNFVGTPNWMAPEIIKLLGPSTKSDIWSLACTIVEMLTGQPPYSNLNQMNALFRIVEDDHPPFPEKISQDLADFLRSCFEKTADMVQGSFKEDSSGVILRHGQGKLLAADFTYAGNWELDKMSGKGRMDFAGGASYEGSLRDNKFNGEGKYTWSDGSYFLGEWDNHRMNGAGKYQDRYGQSWIGIFFKGSATALAPELL
ncbi:hypothetical protein HK101_001238 [Irineochytrium annulatum]|nr:hypothetical protein HK101_001238 [Irineochytrium annulatum]